MSEVHGGPWTAVAELNVLGTQVVSVALPTSGWHVLYVDSQATDCGNYAATNAFDGNPATMWLTEWCHSAPPTPHEIQIDLGANYTVNGFQYLPRQDGSTYGNVANYEFYVSIDGVNWGTAVSTGTLIANASDVTQKQVNFAGLVGRYVRFRAMSEVHGGSWTAVAELNVLGTQVVSVALPTSGWHVLYVDSQATDCGNYPATNAFDDNPATMWLTEWCYGSPTPPHEIQIDLGATYTVNGFQYLRPRQDGGTYGNVADYEFYVSIDGVNWGTAVSTGTLIANASDVTQKQVTFTDVVGRYVRFRAMSEVHGGPWTAVAELNVLGTQVVSVAPVSVSVTPNNATTTTNGTVQFSASVTGSTNTAVTWRVASGGGTVSTSGLYTAPSTAGTASVVATSVADSRSSALANVTINAPTTVLLSASPTSISFGSVLVGASGSQTVNLKNTGNSSVTVSSASFTGSGFGITGLTFPFTVAAAASKSATLTFAPSSSGTASGSVSFVSNAINSPATVALSGSGIAGVQHTANLSWQASGSNVAGFNVYRSTTSGGSYARVNSTTSTSPSYADSTVQSGQTYYYVVTQLDSTGMESGYSSPVAAVIPTP